MCLFFRRLLFLSIDDILGDEAVVSGDPLPHSYVLNFLFSRAPSEMRSPHQVNNIYSARTNFIYIHIHVHVYVHIILILLHVCGIFWYRFRSGLKRSILIGWTNILRKVIDSNSFSECLLFPKHIHVQC